MATGKDEYLKTVIHRLIDLNEKSQKNLEKIYEKLPRPVDFDNLSPEYRREFESLFSKHGKARLAHIQLNDDLRDRDLDDLYVNSVKKAIQNKIGNLNNSKQGIFKSTSTLLENICSKSKKESFLSKIFRKFRR